MTRKAHTSETAGGAEMAGRDGAMRWDGIEDSEAEGSEGGDGERGVGDDDAELGHGCREILAPHRVGRYWRRQKPMNEEERHRTVVKRKSRYGERD
jgi:hypothetical protein